MPNRIFKPLTIFFILLSLFLMSCGDTVQQPLKNSSGIHTHMAGDSLDRAYAIIVDGSDNLILSEVYSSGERAVINCDEETYDDFTLEYNGTYYKVEVSEGVPYLTETLQLPVVVIEIKESDTHAIVYWQ